MDNSEGFNAARGLTTVDEFRQRDKLDGTMAPEISDRIKQCIAFLATLARVDIVDSADKDNYVINVILVDTNSGDDDSAAKLKSDTTSTSFQITRSRKEFKELQHVCKHWSTKHGRKGCTYCPFFEDTDLPSTLSRWTSSKEKTEQRFQVFLNDYIVKARRPRPEARECQGFDHIPSVLTRFIAKGQPPAVAAADVSTSTA